MGIKKFTLFISFIVFGGINMHDPIQKTFFSLTFEENNATPKTKAFKIYKKKKSQQFGRMELVDRC